MILNHKLKIWKASVERVEKDPEQSSVKNNVIFSSENIFDVSAMVQEVSIMWSSNEFRVGRPLKLYQVLLWWVITLITIE